LVVRNLIDKSHIQSADATCTYCCSIWLVNYIKKWYNIWYIFISKSRLCPNPSLFDLFIATSLYLPLNNRVQSQYFQTYELLLFFNEVHICVFLSLHNWTTTEVAPPKICETTLSLWQLICPQIIHCHWCFYI